jgi:nitrogen fixation protein NifU and related proteins
MGDDLDEFIEGLQEQIFEETKAAYGETVYQRWRKPLYTGKMDHPTVHASMTGDCGDTIEMFFKFKNNRIVDASFLTDGCGPSVVCGSFAAEMSIGKVPEELMEINGEMILKRLGGLPKGDEHCAFLAAAAVQEALNAYMLQPVNRTNGESGELT